MKANRKLSLLTAGAVALCSAFAAESWFDAKIAELTDWPSDGSNLRVPGQGEWSGTANAELDDRTLRIESALDTETPLRFDPAAQRDLQDGTLVYEMTTGFTVQNGLPAGDFDAKCGLTVCADEDDMSSLAYCGLVKNPNGAGNCWVRLAGATPSPGEFVAVQIELKKDGDRTLVCYTVAGTPLTRQGESWLEVADTSDMTGAVALAGEGDLSALSAAVEWTGSDEVKTVTLPSFAGQNFAVQHVKVAGVEILPDEDGRYAVARGSVVTITFKPEDGWALNKSTLTLLVRDDLEIALADCPTAVDVSADVTINEVVAKNTLWVTKNGYAEIDWVELKNNSDTDVDLTGWYFFNNPEKKKKNWTKILGSCVVPAHGYKIIWCDDNEKTYPDDGFAADEAYVRCNISTDAGKHTLFLADKKGNILQQIKMPAGVKNVSYGYGRRARTVLGAHDVAAYRIGNGDWTETRGPVGMSAAQDGFTVTTCKLRNMVANLDAARQALTDSSKWSGTPTETTVAAVAFHKSYSGGSYDASIYQDIVDPAFLGQSVGFPGSPSEAFVLKVEGVIAVPRAGSRTFAVGSDGGFALRIFNESGSYTSEFTDPRSYGQSLAAFSFPAPGSYNVELVYFNRGAKADATLDFSVAEGDWTEMDEDDWKDFSADRFHLVGTEESGVRHDGALAGSITSDVTAEMLGVSDTLDWRATFTLADAPAANERYSLRLRYADGFTARVNGETVASVPVSGSPRSSVEAMTDEEFAIPSELLQAGENSIEIKAFNNAVDDPEFFLSPEITVMNMAGEFVYFREPTPGAANDTPGTGPQTPAVVFSVPHGYKTEAFDLELTCPDSPNSAIYYTLDGSSPTIETGTPYTSPIPISRTTCVRAAVPQDNAILQTDTAATYLFLEDIKRQSTAAPSGFPASRSVNGHTMSYGLRTSLSNEDAERLDRGFTNSIATISLVIDTRNLFDPSMGIYVNPSGDGKAWERMTIVEQIDPVNGEANEFTIPAGLRIRGAGSRTPNNPKHSLRLFFRSEYGQGSLKFKLFGNEGAKSFEKVDLRTAQNYSWAWSRSDYTTFIEECFSRDSQRDMGDPYTRSRYYNLFINGIYWGLYQTQERGDEDFAESYLDGNASDFDVIKTTTPGYVTTAAAGVIDPWFALYTLAVTEGFAGEHADNYMKALGRNPDGSENPDYPVYLNVGNLARYMISAHFVGDSDSPSSQSGHPNNIYAIRDRTKRDGFIFLRHDAEHSLGVRSGHRVDKDYTLWGTEARTYRKDDSTLTGNYEGIYERFEGFNPAELHYRLCAHPDYRMAFADEVYKQCVRAGGAMTVPVAEARFRARMAEIDDAIVCEAARWGSTSLTRATWLNACEDVCISYINARMPFFLQHYRARGWYPSIDAPTITVADRVVTLAAAEGATLYYTTDGSDPRRAGGEVGDTAQVFTGTLSAGRAGVALKVRARSANGEWSPLEEVEIEPLKPTVISIR